MHAFRNKVLFFFIILFLLPRVVIYEVDSLLTYPPNLLEKVYASYFQILSVELTL